MVGRRDYVTGRTLRPQDQQASQELGKKGTFFYMEDTKNQCPGME